MRLGRGLYCWIGVPADPLRILSVHQRLVAHSVFAGRTAAWLHGLDIDPSDPLEIIVPPRSGLRSGPGRLVRRTTLVASDVVSVRGVRATALLRTLSDLCPRLGGVDALALVDASLRMKHLDKLTLERTPSPCLRALASIAEPAESPMETRLRWLLLKGGLPRPEVQRNLFDPQGRFVGRADLFYPEARLVIEFDGANHRERLVEDNRRQNSLLNAGFALLRFTAADLREPNRIVAQVSEALSGRAALSARRPAAARR